MDGDFQRQMATGCTVIFDILVGLQWSAYDYTAIPALVIFDASKYYHKIQHSVSG